MKPTEFIVENSIIAQEADDMHRDHEVQMARSQMYSAAQAAIEIHRLLRDVSEMEGLEGWVQSKLTLASQYLESVRDYMKYEAVSQEPEMMAFAESAADYALDQLLVEDDYDDAVKDFLAKGGEIQKGKTHKPRKSERLGGSRHIGGGGEKMKSSRTGISSKPTGKAVAGQASLGEQGVAEGEHPETWHDVDPKLGKQVDKMSQAEKVSKGFAHSDTLKKKTSFVQKLSARLQQLGYTQTQEGNVYRWIGSNGTFVEVEPNTEDPGWYGWAEGQVTRSGKLHYGDSGNDSAKDIVAIFKSGGVFRKQGVAEGKQLSEMATGGSSSAGGMAISMSGPGHKPTSGVPKKIGNSYKPKKVAVGKGIY